MMLITTLSVLLIILITSSNVSCDGSTVFTLNNHRNINTVVFDVKGSENEQLSSPDFTVNSSLVSSDVDEDGYPEIYFTNNNGQLIQYRTKDDTYRIILDGEESRYSNAPQLADIDDDGVIEYLIYDSNSNAIRCFNASSMEEKWFYKNDSSDHGINPQPKVLPPDGSNESRILLLVGPGKLVILNPLGKVLWSHEIRSVDEDWAIPPQMGVADIDLDGDLEAVVISTKTWAGRQLVALDIFSLDPPSWLEEWRPGEVRKWDMASSPPLLTDVIQDEEGLEIIYGSRTSGIWALSSDDGDVLWNYDIDEDIDWNSIEIIRTENGTRIVASSTKMVMVFNTTNGMPVHTYRMGNNVLPDHPLVGYFNPMNLEQSLLMASGNTSMISDPEDGKLIWQDTYEANTQSIRHLLVTSKKDVAIELHVFFHDDTKNRNFHFRYWSPEDVTHQILVEPTSWEIYPNVSREVSGLEITGDTASIAWVILRIYQGVADDLIVFRMLYNGSQELAFARPPGISIEEGNYVVTENSITIDMSLRVRWYFHQFGPLHLQLTVYDIQGRSKSQDVRGWLTWDVNLEVNGEMRLEAPPGNEVGDGNWCRGDVDAKLQGLYITYSDGKSVPDREAITIDMKLEGMPSPIELDLDGQITAEFQIPGGKAGRFIIYIEIACTWTDFRSTHRMEIYLDYEPPEFLDFHPDNGTILGEGKVTVGCAVSDREGSGVGDLYIQSWADGGEPSDWEIVADVTSTTVDGEGRYVLQLGEGRWSYRWRVFDRVGNGPETSPHLTLVVDLTGVVFHEFEPTGWISDAKPMVSVKIGDVGGSGVDLSSIEYSYTTEGLFDFLPWISVEMSGVVEEVTVELSLTLHEGLDNYVVFRAADVVGNSMNSSAYQVKIDQSPPTFLDPSPMEEEVVYNNTIIECTIRIIDVLSGVDIESIQYQYSVDATTYSEWIRAEPNDPSKSHYEAQIPRNTEGTTAIRWRAKDNANEDYAISDEYNIQLNRPPDILSLEPVSPHRVIANADVLFQVNVSDPEADLVSIEWLLHDSIISKNSTFVHTFEQGEYTIILSVDDGNGNSIEVAFVIIVTEDPEYHVEEFWFYGVITILIAFATIGIWFLFHRDRME